MSIQVRMVKASTYFKWLTKLNDLAEQNPNDQDMRRLLNLVRDIGRKSGAIRFQAVGERWAEALAFVPNPDFDMVGGQVKFEPISGYRPMSADELTAEIVKVTGIPEDY